MNKLLREFLSYILLEERVKREPGTSWLSKTTNKWSAKRSNGETRTGFSSKESADAWIAGTGKAPGEEPSPSTAKEKPTEPTKEPGVVSRATSAVKQAFSKVSSGLSKLTQTFRTSVYGGGATGIGTEESTKGETSSCAASQDFISGRTLTIGDSNHAVPANITDEEIESARSKLRGKKGEPHDTRRAIEAAWVAKERQRYIDAGGNPPDNKWLRYAYRAGLSANMELRDNPARNADMVATSQAIADGTIPSPTVTGKEGRAQTIEFLTNLANREGISAEEKAQYERALKALTVAEDTDTTVFYITKTGAVGVMFISNKQSPNDPHGNTTPGARVRRIRESARAAGVPEEVASEVESAVDDAQKTIVAGGDVTTTAKEHFGAMDAETERRAASALNDTFTRLPAGTPPKPKDYTDKILKAKPVKAAMAKLYCEENPDKCKKGKPVGVIPDLYQRENVGRAFIVAVKESKGSSANLQKILGKIGDASQESDEETKKLFGPVISAGQNMRQAAKDAHAEIVGRLRNVDDTYCEKNPNACKDDSGEPINGPATQVYVDTFMRDTHWDQYICNSDDCSDQDAVSETKLVDIDGHKVPPKKFRECLAKLSGYDSDTESHDGQRGLWSHLQRKLKVDPESDSISVHGADSGSTIGKEKYRTKGSAASLLTYLGKDMADCATGKS